ncbi:calpastatin [Polaromonas sp. C04]|nr:calpastatin [Polaromonas sp. C04]
MMDLTMQGLNRFLNAQGPVYDAVIKELTGGKKTTHWMWFVFPQLKGLGRSAIAEHFGIESRTEALAYWEHPVLGERLLECTNLALAQHGKSAHEIFGSPDDLKLKSCMTLFARVVPSEPAFQHALERFFEGRSDEGTLNLL